MTSCSVCAPDLARKCCNYAFVRHANVNCNHAGSIAANAKHIEVFYLPPYSPELNPSEYFNGDLKGEIQRGIPPRNQSELKRTILAHSRRIQKSPYRVRKYFEHELIRYAA